MEGTETATRNAATLEQYRPLIRRFLCRHWKDAHGIDDLVQETMFRACSRLGDLRDPRALEGWLLRIAYNIAMDWHRRNARRDEGIGRHDAVQLHDVVGPVEPPAEHRRETDEARQQWKQGIRCALGKLSNRDRAFMVAHYFVGLSCRQISERSGLTVANVKVRLHRARRSMRRHLPSEDEFRHWLAHRALYAASTDGNGRPTRRARLAPDPC